MTNNTITLHTPSGEAVEVQPPEDCPYFEYDRGLDGKWRFLFPDVFARPKDHFPEIADIVCEFSDQEWHAAPIASEHWKPWEIPIIAAVAACWYEAKALAQDDTAICWRIALAKKADAWRKLTARPRG